MVSLTIPSLKRLGFWHARRFSISIVLSIPGCLKHLPRRAWLMPLQRLYVRLCLFLEASEGYAKAKALARNLLENTRYPYKRYFDLGMILLVLVSVVLLV